uniref:Secreted protein n=1 Tax=Macrostomum lignano TaxID=282301 RepID=A0A1I8FJA6_9PLAT
MVRPPVLVARCLAGVAQLQSPAAAGRPHPPSLLVGHGALGLGQGTAATAMSDAPSRLIRSPSGGVNGVYGRRWASALATAGTLLADAGRLAGRPVSDTVGRRSLAWTPAVSIAVGCLLKRRRGLKQPGESARPPIFGCGCWAESVGDAGCRRRRCVARLASAAVTSGGAGEYLGALPVGADLRSRRSSPVRRAARPLRRLSNGRLRREVSHSEGSGSDIDAHRQGRFGQRVAATCLRREFLGMHSWKALSCVRDAGLLLIRRR